MTPRGAYRDLLERHLGETAAQRDRLQERLRQLGVGGSPLQAVYGLAQAVTGQALALGKLPLDLLRGGSLDEKLLKNAKDEAASEALEIATYDAIEALARALDDPKTVTLAREHRTQEETFLGELRALIPGLAGGVAAGAADEDRPSPGPARAAAPPPGARPARPARPAPAPAPATPTSAAAAPAGDDEPPIAGYDGLTVDQILPKLRSLSADELARIDGYERGGRNRRRVLARVAALREKKVAEELSSIP
jgi:ferritin-like metal-binding protein YciE